MLDPKTLKYQQSHEWLSPDGVVGISDHAQKEITDVVFVELPKVGRQVKRGGLLRRRVGQGRLRHLRPSLRRDRRGQPRRREGSGRR